MTAVWVVVGIWFSTSTLVLLGLCRHLCRELAKADANLYIAWQAGIVQGQLLQADRQENGL